MIKYCQFPFHFDASRLQQEVQQLTGNEWRLHYQTMHYTGEWTALPLRSTGGRTDNIVIAPTDEIAYEDTIFLQSSTYLQEVLASFQCPLLAVRLLNLAPGAVIKEHRDADLSFEKGELRIHIPIFTNPDMEFILDKEPMHLAEGDCWYMNFNLTHSLANKGTTNRIHLVIDAIVNDWVKDLFSTQVSNKKEMDEPGPDAETKKKMIAELRAMNTEMGNKMADQLENN